MDRNKILNSTCKSKSKQMNTAISWFEIGTNDLDRATKFYETIFQVKLAPLDLENIKMRMFPLDDMMTGVGGALVFTNGFHKPSSTDGPLIYLNGNPDLQLVLDRVEAAGGKIMVPKTEISAEYGYMAVIIDSEGNRIGLHSVPKQYVK
jgi:predicted enzyme related to lactoylglutathione lyase